MNPNMMVTCPYNNAHRMKESRLQIHITKCRQDHLDDDHFVCPFNSTHVLPHQERSYHLLRCPDKAPLDRKLAESMDKNNPFKGRTAVPSYSEPLPIEPSEIWDEDEDFEPRLAFAAAKEPPVGAIIQPQPFSKPASRRQLYQELHQMPTEAEPR
ncbi:gametocyte-specific factor 1 [Trichonephila clavata]|uniref:Gametocyte-specific factor 1 n=1 Tax=Trichonephila clavata TaxID=2740835 RepID=A0A8X6L2V0_TRICU|nr:gametocyte-specific factor 1 [Trichonephila clavata]